MAPVKANHLQFDHRNDASAAPGDACARAHARSVHTPLPLPFAGVTP
jgi:hypothetical protein